MRSRPRQRRRRPTVWCRAVCRHCYTIYPFAKLNSRCCPRSSSARADNADRAAVLAQYSDCNFNFVWINKRAFLLVCTGMFRYVPVQVDLLPASTQIFFPNLSQNLGRLSSLPPARQWQWERRWEYQGIKLGRCTSTVRVYSVHTLLLLLRIIFIGPATSGNGSRSSCTTSSTITVGSSIAPQNQDNNNNLPRFSVSKLFVCCSRPPFTMHKIATLVVLFGCTLNAATASDAARQGLMALYNSLNG